MSKNDFGFYGSGLDGYVHYKQSVDRINQSAPMRKYEVKSQKKIRGKAIGIACCLIIQSGFLYNDWFGYNFCDFAFEMINT